MGKKASIQKEYFLEKNSFKTNIILQTEKQNQIRYINEWNLHFAIYDILEINGEIFQEELSLFTNRLEIFDPYLGKKIIFELSNIIEIFLCKNFTVSQSESGLDLTVQHLSIGFVSTFTNHIDCTITFKIEEA